MKEVKRLHVVAYLCIIVCSLLFIALGCCNLPVFTSPFLGDSIANFFTGGWLDSASLGDSFVIKMVWAVVYIVILLAFLAALVTLIVRAIQKKKTNYLAVGVTGLVLFFVIVSLYFFTYYGDIKSSGNRVDRVFLDAFTSLGNAAQQSSANYSTFVVVLLMSVAFIAYLVLEMMAFTKTLKLVESEEEEKEDLSQLTEEDIRKAIREELAAFYENKEEETPVEEKQTEETPAEEKPEEIVEEKPEETVEEKIEEPVEEKVEEVKEETPVEEKPNEEEKPVVAPVVAPVGDEGALANKDSNRISFFERILMVDDEQLDIYNEIKNEILAYGVKSRVSSSGDTFRLHRVTYMKMVFSGKKVKLYMKLDPAKFADSTIPFDDASDKNIYKDIPFVFKVKSGLSIRRAKALIQEMMENEGISKKKEAGNVDYARELIEEVKKQGLK